MKLKMKHVVGFETGDKTVDNTKVKVCGARNPRHPSTRCDEPEWMGEHTWHHEGFSFSYWAQWCECGQDHAHDAPCLASPEEGKG